MAVSARLKTFLAASKAKYKTQKHPVAYTAQEIAAAEHIPGKQLAKCVLVVTNKGPYLAVLPAIHLVDLKKLKGLLRATQLSIGKEADIRKLFPDVEVGAMSVFGNLYDVPVVVDKGLTEAAEIVCNAGTHAETLKLRYRDFAKVVKPKVGLFGLHVAKARAVKAKKSKKRK